MVSAHQSSDYAGMILSSSRSVPTFDSLDQSISIILFNAFMKAFLCAAAFHCNYLVHSGDLNSAFQLYSREKCFSKPVSQHFELWIEVDAQFYFFSSEKWYPVAFDLS